MAVFDIPAHGDLAGGQEPSVHHVDVPGHRPDVIRVVGGGGSGVEVGDLGMDVVRGEREGGGGGKLHVEAAEGPAVGVGLRPPVDAAQRREGQRLRGASDDGGPEEGVVEGVVGKDGGRVAQGDVEALAGQPKAEFVDHPGLTVVVLEEGVAGVPAPEGGLKPDAGGERFIERDPQVFVVVPSAAVRVHVQRGVGAVAPDGLVIGIDRIAGPQIPAARQLGGAGGEGGEGDGKDYGHGEGGRAQYTEQR